jgi:hypothetical protein
MKSKIIYHPSGIRNNLLWSMLRTCVLALAWLLPSQPNSLCEEPQPDRAISPKPEVIVDNNAANIAWENATALDPQREDWLRSELFSGRSEAWSKMQSERSLAQRVSELESQCQLTSDQTKKLLLAGKGDIAKYFRDVESLYVELKPQASEAMDKKTLEGFIGSDDVKSRLKPLRERWRSGLHGVGSLYQGVLKQTLTVEQLTKITTESQQREQLRLTQKLMAFIVNIEKSMPLTSNQRNHLLQKLLSNYSKRLESRRVNVGDAGNKKSVNLATHESYLLTEADFNVAGLVSALMLRPEDLEEFLDAEQVKTMLALQRHWRLNVPHLDAIEDIK